MKNAGIAIGLVAILCAGPARGDELIVNGGFEFPGQTGPGTYFLATPFTPAFALAFGWETSEPFGFEVWRVPAEGLNFAGEGSQLLELNYASNTAIWQFISPPAGAALGYSFMHRARSNPSETVRFEIRDLVTGDLVIDQSATTGPQGWVTYSGEFHGTGNPLKLEIAAISPTGSMGNFIDGVSVVPVPSDCPDLSGNGAVDSLDLAMLLGGWGSPGGEFGGDLNADGIVEGADLGILLGGWGPCP